ncbi:MAG: ATP-binding protein, partial [Spirulinaceae cyanobacterium]
QGTIWIRTRPEGDRILVEIADDGVGIPSDIERRVFEQFFTTKEVGKGTGLGLDIVRRIVEGQHKGSIRVVSQPGDTRFFVQLPIDLCK